MPSVFSRERYLKLKIGDCINIKNSSQLLAIHRVSYGEVNRTLFYNFSNGGLRMLTQKGGPANLVYCLNLIIQKVYDVSV